ncbi:AAA family ATPase [Thiospirochaeta perfilievii]|uniref:AAA family ATPase n=1 Tax=Thiospirochaeta perfilievii TaxID=252967 RepID=A0A5C1Q7B0_9SPIO|nr:AAA family ATPase [Thiospirochaeta perfilievii]QEN03311.1 AAA family ATPase [Thiospirochaeta perfilievii]
MNYWHMQIHPNEQGSVNEKEVLSELGIIGLGDDKTEVEFFEETMKIGDIVAIKRGGKLIALTEVTSDSYYEEDNSDIWFNLRRNVKVLDWNNNPNLILPDPRGTLKRCGNYDAPTSKIIINWHKELLMNKNILEAKKVLKHKKQIILQGAPGTGKTYISAEIAMNLINESKKYDNRKEIMADYQKAVEEGRIAFTTFHQSMDYEEFVEGLKPEITDEGDVTYNVKPGIFKEMCNKAQSKIATPLSDFDLQEKIFEYVLKNKDKEYAKSADTSFVLDYKEGNTNISFKLEKQEEFNSSYRFNVNTVISYIHGIKSRKTNYSYARVLAQHLIDKQIIQVETVEAPKPYILIIDEINRGNISKVLGELITLLESDKRIGEENELRVKLPYSPEDEPFGIPSNLYIIGTMNTADRSVGHIDYAIRRRFSFITLQSHKSAIENYYTQLADNNAPSDIAIKLFEEIEEVMENISPDFDKHDLMIGHSYFMAKTKEDLELKLKYEIKPLLREYVKDGILILTPNENGDYKEIEDIIL